MEVLFVKLGQTTAMGLPADWEGVGVEAQPNHLEVAGVLVGK